MIDESGAVLKDRYSLAISSIESDLQAPDGSLVRGFIGIVRGTATDHEYGRPPEIVAGIIDDAVRIEAVAGWNSESGDDGFLFRFHTHDLQEGEHSIYVVAGSRDGSSHARTPRRMFTIVPTQTVMPVAAYAPTWACATIDWSDRPPSAFATIPNARRIRHGDTINVRGWAIDTIAADSAGDVYLILDQVHAFRLQCRQWRPDVAAAFDFPDAAYCGFVGSIATGFLEPGLHLAQCFVVAKNFFATYRTDAILMFEVDEPPSAP